MLSATVEELDVMTAVVVTLSSSARHMHSGSAIHAISFIERPPTMKSIPKPASVCSVHVRFSFSTHLAV